MVDIRRGDAEFSSFTTSSGVTAAVDVGNVYLYETTLNSFDATIYTAGDVTTRAFTFNRVNVIGKIQVLTLIRQTNFSYTILTFPL